MIRILLYHYKFNNKLVLIKSIKIKMSSTHELIDEFEVATHIFEKSELAAIFRTGASSSQSNDDRFVFRSVI